jgi:hypothetical protein
VSYADFDDFWDSNTVPVGPQGKVIAGMSPGEREQLRARLREQLPPAADGHIFYESFANAVRGEYQNRSAKRPLMALSGHRRAFPRGGLSRYDVLSLARGRR